VQNRDKGKVAAFKENFFAEHFWREKQIFLVALKSAKRTVLYSSPFFSGGAALSSSKKIENRELVEIKLNKTILLCPKY